MTYIEWCELIIVGTVLCVILDRLRGWDAL
jgi:hypothetical protein